MGDHGHKRGFRFFGLTETGDVPHIADDVPELVIGIEQRCVGDSDAQHRPAAVAQISFDVQHALLVKRPAVLDCLFKPEG